MKMKIRAVLIAGVILIALAASATPVFAAQSAPGRYMISIPEGKNLIFRAAPSADSDVIGYFEDGDLAEVVRVDGTWAKARKDGKDGWFALRFGQLQTEYACALLLADINSADSAAVDFQKLADAGVFGVILRLGVHLQDSDIIAADMNIASYYAAARKAGLAVGIYFSSTALNVTTVRTEYEWAIGQLKTLAIQPELPVFFRPSTAAQKALSSATNTLLAESFCAAVDGAGYPAGVYLPADWTTQNMDFDSLDAYAHWIADYGDICNFSRRYDIWQYTDGGAPEGVSGNVGLSYMFQNVSSLPLPEETTAAVPARESTAPAEENTTARSPAADLPVHTEGPFQLITPPDCSNDGLEGAFCLDCGKLLRTRLTPPLGHQDGEWVTVQEASETEDGLAVKYCTVCGKITKEHVFSGDSASHIHVWRQWEYIDAPQAGVLAADTLRYRALLGEPGVTAVGEAGVTGGETPSGRVSPIAYDLIGKYICTADREKILVCTDCGKVIERYAEPPAAHQPVAAQEIVAADCETDGHARTICAVCGAVTEDVVTPAYGHLVEKWAVETPATRETPGVRSGVCLRCGKTVTEPIPAVSGALGDVDGDGRVTSADARLILRAAARLITLDSERIACGDIDGNGVVNSADARIALRVAARLQQIP